MQRQGPLAVFLSTSGHSGVDRVMKNLLPAIAARGIRVDLLHVENHGPYMEEPTANLRVVPLGRSHTFTSLGPLVHYLRTVRPEALLSDKDRVNRVAILARKLARVPTRVVVRTGTTVSHDMHKRSAFDRSLHYLSMHYLYRWADAIITPSAGAAADLAAFARIASTRVSWVPSPVATEQLQAAAREPLDKRWTDAKHRPLVVGVGELSGRKDFATLVRAFAKLRTQRPAKLLILGEGRERPALTRLCGELGIADDVELAGFVANPYPYLAAADLYVHSARYEGSPVALMEAVALGTPVVSTDCPSGPREILQDGRYGPLVPVGDDAAMATAMGAVLDTPPSRNEMRRAAEPYTLENSTDRYLEILGLAGRESVQAR